LIVEDRAVPMIGLSRTVCIVVALTLLAGAMPLFPQEGWARSVLDALVAAYPEALAGHDGQVLRWRDGTLMPVSDDADNKTFPELLRHASLLDQLHIPYARGPLERFPALDADPGRFRSTAFFRKMYGDCQKREVSPRLVSLTWLPKTWGRSIRVTSVNGVDRHLRAVSAEIEALPEKIKRAAYPIADAYNCRAVADTGQPSPHSYGIAIDLNLAASDYWFWRPHAGVIAYRNRMPQEIVAIFEKYGFIWGGKWYHFDTMHFEYRPELLGTGGWDRTFVASCYDASATDPAAAATA
jgi:D-alanyl-D-alanine carboxypeptidase